MGDSSLFTSPLASSNAGFTATDALQLLAHSTGSSIHRSTAAAALRSSAHSFGGNDLAELRQRFAMAGAAVGLRLHEIELSPSELRSQGREAIPLVACAESPGAEPAWLAVTECRRRKARLHSGSGGIWVDYAQLAVTLGLPSVDERIPWFTAEAAMPFAEAAVPPAPAEHEGHRPSDGHHVTPWSRLVALARSERHDIGVVVVFAVAVGVMALATPLAVEALVTTVAFGGLIQPLVVLSLMLLLFLSLGAMLRGVQTYVVEVLQQRVFVRLVADLAYRLPRARAESFDRQYGPELMNRFFDVLTVQKTGALLLLDGLAIVLQTVIGMVLVAIVIVVFGMGRGAVRTSIAESRAKYDVAAWLEELARHPTAFHTRLGSEYALHRADALATFYVQHRRAHFRVVMRQIVGALSLQVLASVGLLGLGGWLVMAGQLTLGQLVAAELIVTVIVGSFAKMGKHLEGFYDLLAAMEKLGHLTDLPIEPAGAVTHRADGPAALRLINVAYGFGKHPVVRGVHMAIESGERCAIVGPPGAGKSLLLDLMHGARAPAAGHVELDGLDLRELRLDVVQDQVAMIRDVEIFAGTIADNVHLDRPGVGPIEVRRALDAVGLLNEVLEFPSGLQTPLLTGGRPLSESQTRRLMLARAIAARPRVLLLDRALDGLPSTAASATLDAFLGTGAPWTAVVVTDDPAVLARCPRRIELADEEYALEQDRARSKS
jgi:putative ABC transport system ATP-binding protein